MRIAMIGPFGFHPNKTMQSRALGLARALVARGHDVAIFMPPWQTPEAADSDWVDDGVFVRYVALGGGTAAILLRLVRETTAWRPDVVHCFKPKAYSGLVAWWFWHFRRGQTRLIVDMDDWEGAGGWNERGQYSALQKRFFAWQEEWGMRHCEALTVASETLRALAWSHGLDPARVLYVPNGPGVPCPYTVFDERWAKARAETRARLGVGERPLILLYSRLFEFDTARLVSILAQVKGSVPDLAILSIGTGLFANDAAKLRAQLATARLLDDVVDVGWVEQDVLPCYFAAADVGVYLMDDTLLNRTKCPVKLADMVSAGLPVVGEAVGEVASYVVNGNTGFIHPTGAVSELGQSIIALLQDGATRRKMARAAQRHAARFTWENRAAQLESLYQTL